MLRLPTALACVILSGPCLTSFHTEPGHLLVQRKLAWLRTHPSASQCTGATCAQVRDEQYSHEHRAAVARAQIVPFNFMSFDTALGSYYTD